MTKIPPTWEQMAATWEHYAAGLREQARLAPDPVSLLASAAAADDVATKIRTETETDARR